MSLSFSLYGSLSPSPDMNSPDGFDDLLASPLATPQTTNTTLNDYSSSNAVVTDAWRRFEMCKRVDDERNILIEEMIHRYSYVSQEYTKLLDEVERQKRIQNGTLISTNSLYKEDYEKLKRKVDREPFILVLIDGDGMLFHEHFLSQGEEGGKKAAAVLLQSTDVYAREQIPTLPNETKVVARMYANVKGLADACARAGHVPTPGVMEDFVRGFTRGNPLFDFVDVGPGKDRADEKVSEMFKLHAYDVRCKHIVFGCSHDNGFARLLEKYIYDETITKRVTLLEGCPFGQELLELPFHRAKFGTIFRSQKIVCTPLAIQPPVQRTIIPSHGVEGEVAAALLRSMNHTPSESVSSLGDAGYGKANNVATWAGRAAVAATIPPPTPPIENSTPEPTMRPLTKDTIPRNRKGCRIDPPVKHDKSEVERVRKLKMCNVHYLRGECPYNGKCTHKHNVVPTKKDLEILKVVARYACCRAGGGCDDPRCIYGHRCQAPERLDPLKWPTERGKTCIFGPECVFPPELHNIDTNVVKLTKV